MHMHDYVSVLVHIVIGGQLNHSRSKDPVSNYPSVPNFST